MNVEDNLLAAERAEILKLFARPCFRVRALVAVGDPPEAFVAAARALVEKEAVTKELPGLQKKEDGEAEKKPAPEIPDDFKFRKPTVPDLPAKVVSSGFLKFTLPSASELPVEYVWSSESDATTYLKTMQFARKLSEFDDTLTPSSYSKEKMDEWLAKKLEWRKKQKDWAEKKKSLEKKREEAIAGKKKEESGSPKKTEPKEVLGEEARRSDCGEEEGRKWFPEENR